MTTLITLIIETRCSVRPRICYRYGRRGRPFPTGLRRTLGRRIFYTLGRMCPCETDLERAVRITRTSMSG